MKRISFIKGPLDNSIKIWRFMDFTKFVSLITKNALFFSRADKLGDPFEGSWPRNSIEKRPEILGTGVDKVVAKEISNNYGQYSKKLITHAAINCWHANKYESAAMWKTNCFTQKPDI